MREFAKQISALPAEPGWTVTTDFGDGPEVDKVIAWAIVVEPDGSIGTIPITVMGYHPMYASAGILRFNGVEQRR